MAVHVGYILYRDYFLEFPSGLRERQKRISDINVKIQQRST